MPDPLPLPILNFPSNPRQFPPAGDYDGKIPDDTPSGEYSIRVGRFEDSDLFDCSGTFRIVERND